MGPLTISEHGAPGITVFWLGPRTHVVEGDVRITADYLISCNGVTYAVVSEESGFIPIPRLECA